MPGARGQMLRVLSGTRRGWFGRFPLPADFLDAMEARLAPGWQAPANEAGLPDHFGGGNQTAAINPARTS
jgi:hypothetical protein